MPFVCVSVRSVMHAPPAGGSDAGEVQGDGYEPGQLEERDVERAQGQSGQVQQQCDREQHSSDDGGDDGLLRTLVISDFPPQVSLECRICNAMTTSSPDRIRGNG